MAESSSQHAGSNQPLYLPLLESHVIRLLHLEPGAPDDPVVLRLALVELEHAPDYEAISYVWGSPTITKRITCNGRPLDVTVNLHAALVRLRYPDQDRTLWADAVCINQGHVRERSHHVAFMNIIYRYAKDVLVCMGRDPDGGAKDVVALIDEHKTRTSGHTPVSQMPIISPDDPLLDDPRWKSLAVLLERPWFSRAWVLQEVGMGEDPKVFYGDSVFSYRDLMQVERWIERCASNLQTRHGISFLSIHIGWEYWTPDWRSHSPWPEYTLLDFLGQARGLSCREPKDHIYAFLGHPLAQLEDGSGPIIQPDYEKDTRAVYQETATILFKDSGLRTLSSVEHDYSTIAEDFPSWVFRGNVELVQNALGVWRGYYFRASASVVVEPPTPTEENNLGLRAIIVDVVSKTYQFSTTSEDLESPSELRSRQPGDHQPVSLDRVWHDIHSDETPCKYPSDERLKAFSLTLCAGLTNYERAEDDFAVHWANFVAYWRLRLQCTSTSPSLEGLEEGEKKGDEERFWLDMSLSGEGRSFLITQRGYYCLGPWIAEPGDLCCVLLGANVPFVLRKTDKENHYRLVGETYIHGLMRGEVLDTMEENGYTEDSVIIC
ncbi:hypothetical protein GP486_004482 [Trichoglossum hirsutum]|uniref:Heterokaryon incompatibility domain-containing protein n=1 Tax=Trichoglossum hirsutum TaxID=265104 RepID=A0A9P8RPN0_9PEZI|nr:hypothetical protein GP486_004482 [Trichoglossum hirsutum]